MKTFFMILSLLLSVAQAGDRNSAYNAICKPMTFESERADCAAKIKHFSYFDDRGLIICTYVVFDNDKLKCLKALGDKIYDDYEMDRCIDQTFESDKIKCLNESGSPYGQGRVCVQREEVMTQLDAGIREMRAGNLISADNRLSHLLQKFVICNK